MSATTLSARALDAATPATRDRYVDLLRVGSLGTVILGHWLMITPVVGADGGMRVTNLLTAQPRLQVLTWLLQVMPVFFLVGGFSQATALARHRRGGSYADFARSRAVRLLRPTAVFAGVWLALGLAAGLAGADLGMVRIALRTVAQPLWFLGVYLAVVALAPATLRLHRWAGRWAAVVPAGLFAAAAGVDALRFAGGVPHVAYLNVALVWIGVHQLGYLYADGTLRRGGRRLAWALAGGGLSCVVVLTVAGPYPVSMVGVPGEPVSNMSPPTVALVAHAVWLTGLVLLLRGPATRWLARARVWRVVVAGNLLAMTAFLWHLTAAFVALAGTAALGWAGPPAGSAAWWSLRAVWLAVLIGLTAGLVAVFRRFDAPRPAVPPSAKAVGSWRDAVAAFGVALATLGVLGVSAVGFGGLLEGRTAMLIVLPIGAPAAIALTAAGAALLAATGRTIGRAGG